MTVVDVMLTCKGQLSSRLLPAEPIAIFVNMACPLQAVLAEFGILTWALAVDG